MKCDLIVLKCQECGEEFIYEYHGRGKKAIYCENCREKKVQESRNKYIEKQKQIKDKKPTEVIRPIEVIRKKYTIDNHAVTGNDIFVKAREMTPDNQVVYKNLNKQELIDRLIKFANDIDGLRVKLCDFSKELSYYQSNYDRSDQVFMHKIENVDPNNIKELQEFMKEFKTQRNQRRDVKDIILIVSGLIDAMPFKCYSNVIRKIRSTTPAEK